jgi:two-component system chemotaxis response regulator CheB
MAKRDIVVIGASAGGIYALRDLVASLPDDFAATIFIVQHVAAHTTSYLPHILNQAGKLKAAHPTDGERIQAGHIYVAPPDHHLLVENDQVLVKKGPKENGFRPSIDALFRSAAYTYGPRVIGVVLTGLLTDGTSGMWSVKRLGGISVIQEPREALYASMPQSVAQNVAVDYTVSIDGLGALLSELIQENVSARPILLPQEETRMAKEVKIAEQHSAFDMNIMEEGEFTLLTCPECHGSLVSIQEGKLIRYRCHTGHGFTATSLLAGVNHSAEESLWSAIRSLEETVILLNQTARTLAEEDNLPAAQTYITKAGQVQQRIQALRLLVFED